MPVKTLRIIFGLYLVQHFVTLLPWGAELFSNRGVLPDASTSPLIHAFPNVLALWDSPISVTILLLIATAASTAFLCGWRDRPAAIVIWYILACLFGRNPLILNPAMPFLGWLLLAHAVALPRRDFLRVAWILMAVAYAYSGWTKLVSPSWIDGTAVEMILRNPLARPGVFRNVLLDRDAGPASRPDRHHSVCRPKPWHGDPASVHA